MDKDYPAVHKAPGQPLVCRILHIASLTVTWCLSPLPLFKKDISHLNNTEVPVEPEQPAFMEGLTLQRQKRAVQDMELVQDRLPYLQDPCDPNPCQNDGVCVNVKGRASCRYHRPLPCLPWLSSEPNDAAKYSELQASEVWATRSSRNSRNQTLPCNDWFLLAAIGDARKPHYVVLPGDVNSLQTRWGCCDVNPSNANCPSKTVSVRTLRWAYRAGQNSWSMWICALLFQVPIRTSLLLYGWEVSVKAGPWEHPGNDSWWNCWNYRLNHCPHFHDG